LEKISIFNILKEIWRANNESTMGEGQRELKDEDKEQGRRENKKVRERKSWTRKRRYKRKEIIGS